MLAGRYRRGEPAAADSGLGEAKPFADRFLVERNFDVLDGLEAFAHARGRTTIELALSWLSRRPTVASIMVGASRPAQIEANVAATGWDLDADELAEIDRLTVPPLKP
jgi:aryl-alcohol dehydrogenase-like predicted oxidoreductase